jgi:hypothetical protein
MRYETAPVAASHVNTTEALLGVAFALVGAAVAVQLGCAETSGELSELHFPLLAVTT